MTTTDDVFDAFEVELTRRATANPWARDTAGATTRYRPADALLAELIGIPIAAGSGSESGRLAKAVDAWIAHELRRAGFGADEVWPRLTKPRVLPRDLALFIEGLPAKDRDAARARVLRNKRVAPSDARGLGQRSDVYDATCLVVGEWDDPPSFAHVRLREDLVPEDLRAGRFLATLIAGVLERTPIDMHVGVREARDHHSLPIEERDEAGGSR